jgi:hypothetical protein
MEDATQVVNGVTSTKYKLPNGGTLIIYHNPVTTEEQQAMSNEILTCYQQCEVQIAEEGNSTKTQSKLLLLCKHFIRNSPEPRLHCLLHESYNNAPIDQYDSQPGYKYSSVTMKAQSLEGLHALKSFSACLEQICCKDNPTVTATMVKVVFGILVSTPYFIEMEGTICDDGNDVVQFVFGILVSTPYFIEMEGTTDGATSVPVIGSFQFQKWWGSITRVVYELYILCRRELFSSRRDLYMCCRGFPSRRQGLFVNMWGLCNPLPQQAHDIDVGVVDGHKKNTHAIDTT